MGELLGIDVSHWQGTIDWEKVATSGKTFCVMKCQYEAKSHNIDEQFEANYKGCGENGIARGVYIYIARASMADPESDINALLNHLNGRKLEYGIWLDLEDSTLRAKGKAYIRELAYKYADAFMKAGYFVGIYCNRDWYINVIHEDLKQDFDFWIARYPSNDTGTYNVNSSLKPSDTIAVAWQYSSKGKVDGINGTVDLNVDYDGIIELIANEKTEVSYPTPERTLKRGCKGDDVKWLQFELKNLGFDVGNIDGIYGAKTEKSVKQFQEKVFVDGIAGTKTIDALKK